MRFVVLAVAFAALAASAWAGPSERNSFARLVTCAPADRAATFQGEIRSYKGTTGLSLRFTLQTRDLANPDWRKVQAPGFGQWLRARTGAPGYVYDKGVEGLAVGADYRVIVRFRWRDTAGKVVANEVKRSRACRLPDTRANLIPESLDVLPGTTESMRTYSLVVANRGQTAAPQFFVQFGSSEGQVFEDSTDSELAPEATVELRFEAPACVVGSQLTATVDTEAEVDEASEIDNVLSVACPTANASRASCRLPRINRAMKTEIHPEYVEAHVRCTCGNEFTTRSTKPEIHVEICSNCHPFYTGRQKLVDTGGRVERFQRRAAKRAAAARK